MTVDELMRKLGRCPPYARVVMNVCGHQIGTPWDSELNIRVATFLYGTEEVVKLFHGSFQPHHEGGNHGTMVEEKP